MKRRILSIITALALCLSLCPTWAFAAETDPSLCKHHPEHIGCGYIAPSEGQPCGHEHTDECRTMAEDGSEVLNCQHEHDEACGYIQADPGQPCAYACRLCPIEALIAALPDAVTEDNSAEVRARLNEILDLCRELDEDEADRLDLSRVYALQAELDAGNVPAPATESVTYIDADGSTKTANCTVISADMDLGVLPGGWYVVKGRVVTNSQRPLFQGETHIILTDGCYWEINIGLQATNLTIYGQSDGTGELAVKGPEQLTLMGQPVIGDHNDDIMITINGGYIYAQQTAVGTPAIGTRNAKATVTINGGLVIVETVDDAQPVIGNSNNTHRGVTINGGVVAVRNTDGGGLNFDPIKKENCIVAVNGAGTVYGNVGDLSRYSDYGNHREFLEAVSSLRIPYGASLAHLGPFWPTTRTTENLTADDIQISDSLNRISTESEIKAGIQASISVRNYVSRLDFTIIGWNGPVVTKDGDYTYTAAYTRQGSGETVSKTFTLPAVPITDGNVNLDNPGPFDYNENDPTASFTPTVTVTVNGRTLTENTDYTVEYANNNKIGTAKVTVTGMGCYEGTVTKTFLIQGNVPYLDENGVEHTVAAIPIGGSEYDTEMTLADGKWYVVDGTASRLLLNVKGTANLILADGCTLNNTGLDIKSGGSLTVYGQSGGSGRWNNASSTAFSLSINGQLTVNGGGITAYIRVRDGGAMTLNRGTVSATSQSAEGLANDGTFTINGGTFSASSLKVAAISGTGKFYTISDSLTEDMIELSENIAPNGTDQSAAVREKVHAVKGISKQKFVVSNWTLDSVIMVEGDPSKYTVTYRSGEKTVSATLTLKDAGAQYIDENGEVQICENWIRPTVGGTLKKSITLNSGWYLVDQSMSVSSITVSQESDVKLILVDGCTLSGEVLGKILGSLTIYAQSTGNNMGKLSSSDISSFQNLTINSGRVTVNGSIQVATTINGGIIDVTSFTKTVTRNKGIIFENGAGKVYGNVTLDANLEVPAGRSLTIPVGASLTGTGVLSGEGTFKTQNLTAEMISVPDNRVADGETDYANEVKLAGTVTICGQAFTPDASGWTRTITKGGTTVTEVKEAGTYTVTYTRGNRTVTKEFILSDCAHDVSKTFVKNSNGTHSFHCSSCGQDIVEDCTYSFSGNTGACQDCGSQIIVSVNATGMIYDGTPKEPTVTVTVDGKPLPADKYTVTCSSNTNAGTASVTVAIGDSQGSYDGTFSIGQRPLTVTGATVTSRDYNGTANVAVTAITLSGAVNGDDVAVNTDSLTSTISSANAGDYTEITLPALALTGTKANNYTLTQPNGAVPATVKISPLAITITPDSDQKKEYGAADPVLTYKVTPSLIGNDKLTGALTYEGADVGKYPITLGTLSAGDNYTLTVVSSVMFEITKPSLENATVTVDGSFTYNGEAQTPTADQVTVKLGNTIISSEQYTISGSSINAGEATVTITATANGNYSGSASGEFTIGKAPLTIKASDQTITYSESITQGKDQVDATGLCTGDSLNSITLVPSTDNVPGGTIKPSTAVIKNASSEDVTGNYDIKYQNGTLTINKADVTITPPTAQTLTYTGAARALVTAGTANVGDVVYSLTETGPYSKTIPTGTDAGDYTVWYMVEGNDNYNSVVPVKVDVTINRKPVTPTVTITPNSYEYTGSAIHPSGSAVKVLDGTDEIPASEYTLSYGENIHVGTNSGSVTVTDSGSGNYEITTTTQNFTITKKLQTTLSITGKPGSTVYGDMFTLTADGGSGDGTVTWNVTSGPATVSASGEVEITGVGSVEIKAVKAGGTDYEDAEAILTFEATKKPVTATVTAQSKTYDGTTTATVTATVADSDLVSGDSITITGVTGTFSDANVEEGKTVTVDSSNATITGTNAENYILTFPNATASITKASAAITTTPTVKDTLTYNGSAQELVNAGAADLGNVVYALSEDGSYSEAIPTGTNAGDYTVWYKVDGTTNYNGTDPVKVDVNIGKAAALTPQVGTLNVQNGYEKSYTFDLDRLRPTLGSGQSFGNVTYTLKDVNITETGYYTNGAEINGSTLTVPIQKVEADTEGQLGTITVTISCTNFADVDATIKVCRVKQTPVTIDGVTAQNGTYNGGEHTGYTGTPTAEPYNGGFTFTYTGRNGTSYNSTMKPTNAGDYTVTVTLATATEYTGTLSLDFTISKATVTIKADNQTADVGTAKPALTYTVTGLASGETLATVPTMTCNADMDTIGEYLITASGAAVPNTGNYETAITYVDGTLTVKDPTIHVTGVSLDRSNMTLTVGGTGQLTATVTPDNATNKGVTWESSNTAVATVNSSGTVTAVSAGSATITVTTADGGKTAACAVTVNEPYVPPAVIPITNVRLNRSSQLLKVGEGFRLTATVEPVNTTQDKTVTWSSSNRTVADVDNSGTIIARAPGTAVITVRTMIGGYTASCTVTVEEPEPETYTITYSSNGGTGTMAAGTATAGKAFTLPVCGFTAPKGKLFDTWAIGSVSGEKVQAGGSHVFTANTTVYAIWKDAPAKSWTVSYNANGGTGTMADSAVPDGEALTLPGCGFTPPVGKVFDAWAVGSPRGERAEAGSAYTCTADTVLYALWKDAPAETYMIVYNANGGSGTMADGIAPDGEEFILPGCNFTAPVGKVFDTWAIGSVSGEKVQAGGSYMFAADTTVYALWKDAPAEHWVISYNANGGAGAMADSSVPDGEAMILPECGFTAPAGKTFDGWAIGGVNGPRVQAGGSYTFTADTTVYAVWKDLPPVAYNITGIVRQNGAGVPGATVQLKRGAEVIAQQITGADGSFSFSSVPAGVYNLVAEKDGITMTVMQEITGSSASLTITLPNGKTNTVVEIKDTETPPVVVGELENLFDDETIYTAEDKEIVAAGGAVEFKMEVEKQDAPPASIQIEAIKPSGQTVGLYLDLSITKTVTPKDGAPTSSTVTETGSLIETLIPLPVEMQGKNGYVVYRVHDGVAEALPNGGTGERYEISADKTAITIFAQKFSTYAIAWSNGGETPVDPPVPPIPSGPSSGTTVKTYAITVEKAEHGTVTSSRTNAASGTTITLTVMPDAGYVLLDLTVTDSQGNKINVTERNTFTMPARAVTVTAVFVPLPEDVEQPCDGGADCPSRRFSDLGTVGTWYHEAVDYALRNGLMNGYNSTMFGPDDNLSRAQLAQILYNKEGKPAVTGGSTFTDVASGQWYAPAITWAAANSIVGGYGNGLFGPDDKITREQLAVMLWRYAGSPAATDKELHFTDADEAGDWALEALRWAAENGILNGYGDGRLNPGGLATRAQVAQMLKNFIEN